VGFAVDKVALGHVFSEYVGFPCQSKWPQYKGLSTTTLAIKKNCQITKKFQYLISNYSTAFKL
jgi:hypothetical protein